MAHTCNPRYLGGRDEDQFEASQGKQSRPYLKKKSQKGAGGVAQGIGPEFKPQHSKEKKS
jgi:hypothetical protein